MKGVMPFNRISVGSIDQMTVGLRYWKGGRLAGHGADDWIMEASAVTQAKARFRKAERAVEAFRASTDFDEAEAAWTDFLLAVSTIYSKLEQGSKGHRKSAPWFGMKKRERRVDPLLKYLHFARNADEHGIERVTGSTGPNLNWDGRRRLKFNERVPVRSRRADPVTKEPVGEYLHGVVAGPTLKPIRVYDRRFGDFCDPPTTHRGSHIIYGNFVDGLADAVTLPLLANPA